MRTIEERHVPAVTGVTAGTRVWEPVPTSGGASLGVSSILCQHDRMTTSGPAVRAKGVRKSFDLESDVPVRALRGVDLEVGTGEFVAITGPSGCGKSTLLNVLSGLEEAEDGEVCVAGHDLRSLSRDDRARFRRASVGIVFQEVHLLDGLSVAANVALPTVVAGGARDEADRRAREVLALAGVTGRADRPVTGLSGGERQRVAVARALANRAPVLLADEPTGSLDTAGRNELLALFERLHGVGQTIVLVSHDPVVAAAADRTLHMIDGRIEPGAPPTRVGGATG